MLATIMKFAQKRGKAEVLRTLKYEDQIHADTSEYLGYPPEKIEGFRQRSYEHIYEILLAQAR